MKASGGCLCGAVRYELDGEPIFQGHCHCVDCQKATGTGHISVVALPADAVKVTGKVSAFAVMAESGQPYTRHFCPTCGSLVYGEPASMPGVRTVPAGTLDDVTVFEPQMVIYTRSRPSWDRIDSGLPEFEGMPQPG
ncbi:MAG TPA: GFA family protein [Caulobacteraceae bacterium]